MESCAHSSEKKIYLNIHTENQNFIVIKIGINLPVPLDMINHQDLPAEKEEVYFLL